MLIKVYTGYTGDLIEFDMQDRSSFTAKLICVFVFAYAKSRFSQDAAHLIVCNMCFHFSVFNGFS